VDRQIKTVNEFAQIILPLPPKILSPNVMIATMRGRYAKAAAARKYRKLTKELIEDEKIETAPWKKIRVTPSFVYKDKRRRDFVNALASLKSAYDGIVDSGLVEDDDSEHMEIAQPEFFIDKMCPKLTLTIERIE